MKFFLDEGVPKQIGDELKSNGFYVIPFVEAAVPGTPDNVVADIAIANEAVLVAVDRDMREIAKALGVSKSRYKRLSLLAFRCREPDAIRRLSVAIPYIQLQLKLTKNNQGRRLFIEVFANSVKVYDF
jgi:predicted nuclease of predicted toxin-antitoxin system